MHPDFQTFSRAEINLRNVGGAENTGLISVDVKIR
jgi:hypothetical protein